MKTILGIEHYLNHILQYEDAPPFDQSDLDSKTLKQLFQTCQTWKRTIFNLMIFGEPLTPEFTTDLPVPETLDDVETAEENDDIDIQNNPRDFVIDFADDNDEEVEEDKEDIDNTNGVE